MRIAQRMILWNAPAAVILTSGCMLGPRSRELLTIGMATKALGMTNVSEKPAETILTESLK